MATTFLDSLNVKQRVKEYKATIKDLKSKDPEVKAKAMEKFADCRYITEGGAIIPLLDSIPPKKVR